MTLFFFKNFIYASSFENSETNQLFSKQLVINQKHRENISKNTSGSNIQLPPWEIKIKKKLDSKINYTCPKGNHIQDIVNELSKITNLPIYLGPNLLEEEKRYGFDLKAKETMRFDNLPVKEVLIKILKPMELYCGISRQNIKINSKNSPSQLQFMVYDISDLLKIKKKEYNKSNKYCI